MEVMILCSQGISTSRKLESGEEPVSSPLSSPALLGPGKEEEEQKIIPKRKKVQAVLKAIKQVCSLSTSPTCIFGFGMLLSSILCACFRVLRR